MRTLIGTGTLAALFLCSATATALDPCLAGSAAGYDCDGVDLHANVPLGAFTAAPVEANDVWGYVDLNSHREFVFVGTRDGTAVFDVTEPDRPAEIGFVPGQATTWRDIKVHQFYDTGSERWHAYAYVTADTVTEGLLVIDLAGLPNSVTKTPYVSDFSRAHNVYAVNVDYATGLPEAGATPRLAVAGSNLEGGRFRLYSLDDPAAPADPLTAFDAGDVHDQTSLRIADARKDTQCVNAAAADACDVLIDFGEDAVDVWDITVPATPVRLSQATYPNLGFVHSGWWTEDRRFLLVHDEDDERAFGLPTRVIVLSIDDLTNPAVAGTWIGPGGAIDHNGYARGNRYYVSNYTRGLTILDITDPATPVTAGRFDTYAPDDSVRFDGAWGVFPFLWSGTVAVSDTLGGLFLLHDATRAVPAGGLGFDAATYGAVEGASALLRVERRNGSSGSVSVGWELLPARGNTTDVAAASGRLEWADGDAATRDIVLPVAADGLAEGIEDVIVRLVDPAGGATLADRNTAVVYLSDPGASSSLRLLDDAVRVPEAGAGRAVIVVNRIGSAVGAVTVDYAVVGVTATVGEDIGDVAAGTLSWPDGDASPRSLRLAIIDDGDDEPDETVRVVLTNAQGAALAASDTASVTIVDDDAAPPPPPPPPRSSGGGAPGAPLLLLLTAAAARRVSRKGFA